MSHVIRVKMLYKTILKLHRGLPKDLQVLGTSYVKDEFKKHIKCNPEEARVFMYAWTDYALMLAEQLGLKGPKYGSTLGQDINSDKLDLMRDEQVYQLYELMLAAKENPKSKDNEKNS